MTENGTIIRSIEEITISAKLNMQDMINKAMQLGKDFSDAKELLGHGKFLPWLEKLGVSSSTASNYMRVAREITPGSRMASLPYSKALALLAAPAEEREELAAQADDKSAAEIRKLIEERNRAAEAANAETARADQAEKDAKVFNQENAHLRTELQTLQVKLAKAEHETHKARCDLSKQTDAYERQKNRIDELHAKLLEAENNVVEVEKIVEVEPKDYRIIKMQLENAKKSADDLIEAAAMAEERAAQLEAENEELKSGKKEMQKPVGILLNEAVNTFFRNCDMMPYNPIDLQKDSYAVRHSLESLQEWIDRMHAALESNVLAEGAVK